MTQACKRVVISVVALASNALGPASACDLSTAVGLRLDQLTDSPQYGGDFSRGPTSLAVHGQPTFWQVTGGAKTCGASLQAGDCQAIDWKALAAEDATACLALCEAERNNGCCRFGSAQDAAAVTSPRLPAPDGCALGHSRRGPLAPGVSGALTADCSGISFIFYCDLAEAWNLAPASAWSSISAGACATKQGSTLTYSHTLAIGQKGGPQNLKHGFKHEWRYRSVPGGYYAVSLAIAFSCSEATGGSNAPTPAPTGEAGKAADAGDDTSSGVMLSTAALVAIVCGVAVLIGIVVLVTVACMRRKSVPSNGGARSPAAAGTVSMEGGTSVVVGRPIGGACA